MKKKIRKRKNQVVLLDIHIPILHVNCFLVVINIMGPFELNLLLLKLKIENWKYCNKIIFKYVNNILDSFLIFFSAWTVLWIVINSMWTVINSVWIIIFVSCIVNLYEITIHAQEKKNQKIQNLKTQTSTLNTHYKSSVPVTSLLPTYQLINWDKSSRYPFQFSPTLTQGLLIKVKFYTVWLTQSVRT